VAGAGASWNFGATKSVFTRAATLIMGVSPKREENLTKSKAFLAQNGGGTWTQIAGPVLGEIGFRCATLPLDFELVARHARDRKAAIAERDRRHPVPVPLIGPHDPPVNIVGGYRFPDAPAIDLSPITTASVMVANSTGIEFGADLVNPDDLSIPPFLQRGA
jgi:hypothetical protein